MRCVTITDAELAELRARLSAAEQERDVARAAIDELTAGVIAAEARAEAAEQERAQAVNQLERWKGCNLYPSTYRDAVEAHAAAEARAEALATALEDLLYDSTFPEGTMRTAQVRARARAALAGREETGGG